MQNSKTNKPKQTDYSISYIPTDFSYNQKLEPIKGSILDVDIEKYKCFGFQNTRLYESYKILEHAIKENYDIILAFTSNAITSGLRQLIALLCRYKIVSVLATTCGGIEEDLLKTKFKFRKLDSKISDLDLRKLGLNRSENILVPNTGYLWLERYLQNLYSRNKALYNTDPITLVKEMSSEIPSEQGQFSFLYWAYVNDLLVLPLGLEDGAIGDFLACENFRRANLGLDKLVLNCSTTLHRYLQYNFKSNRKKCVWVLGGSIPKHFVVNGLIPSNGADLGVYLNNDPILEGSNSAADFKQATSWNKIKEPTKGIKLQGDFNLTFPIICSALIKYKIGRSRFKLLLKD